MTFSPIVTNYFFGPQQPQVPLEEEDKVFRKRPQFQTYSYFQPQGATKPIGKAFSASSYESFKNQQSDDQ